MIAYFSDNEIEQGNVQLLTNNDKKDPTNIFDTEERPKSVVSNNVNIKKIKECESLANLYSLINCKWNLKDRRLSWHTSSINEHKITKLCKTHLKELVDFQRKQLTKVYPAGLRVDSSNYNPIPHWNVGVQIVALNAQTIDEGISLNYAKFIANGACGYVLKPDFLRHIAIEEKDLTINKYLNNFTKPIKKLTIKIISGKQLKRKDDQAAVNSSVEIKLKGLDIDQSTNSIFKTPTIKDNGFNPVWSKEKECKVEFNIHCPDLCCILFNIINDDILGSHKIAWYAIEFHHLVQGYRAIPLIDNNFDPIHHAYILCHINIEDL